MNLLLACVAVVLVREALSVVIVIDNGLDPDFHSKTACLIRPSTQTLAREAARLMGSPGTANQRPSSWASVQRPSDFGASFQFPISGTLTCTEHNVEYIHVRRVVMGFSPGGRCGSPWVACAQDVPTSELSQCEAGDEKCVVSVQPRMHPGCAFPTNFVYVDYECMNGDETVFDVCKSYHIHAVKGTVAVTSPGWPRAPSVSGGSQVSCQCELRAHRGATIVLEYMKTEMPGNTSQCNHETVLFEGRATSMDRYEALGEVCGTRAVARYNLHSSQVRVTYLANGELKATLDRRGFIAKLTARNSMGQPVPLTSLCGEVPPEKEDDRQAKFRLRV